MIQLLTAEKQIGVPEAPEPTGEELWIGRDTLEELTGWQLKPEGLCKGDVCTPVAPEVAARCVDAEKVDVAGLWKSLGRPLLRDRAGSTWMLGEAASDRSRTLESLEAPDFTLPDIEGKLHSLSDYRGKKVFLSTWASW